MASMSNKRSLKLLDMNSKSGSCFFQRRSEWHFSHSGNAFGEEGIQNITLKAEELNLRGALGSFE